MRLLLCSSYPHLPETRGGLQTSTDDLCHELRARGHWAAVLCGTEGAAAQDDGLGYPVWRAPDPAAALPQLIRDAKAEIVIVQSGRQVTDLLTAALDHDVALAVYLHNVELHTIGGVLPPDPRILYFANSHFTAARWRAFYGVACAVLPPFILPDRYRASQTGDRILFVNPVPQKGLELAMRLAAANPDLPFLVAESWSAGADWRAWLRRRFGSLANVDWRAATDDPRTLYADSRVLLMPSVWEEAYGRSVIEAQLNGLPCLVSRRGGLPEAVGAGGVALELEAADAEWSAALRDLYFDVLRWEALSEAATANAAGALDAGGRALGAALARLADHAARPRTFG